MAPTPPGHWTGLGFSELGMLEMKTTSLPVDKLALGRTDKGPSSDC